MIISLPEVSLLYDLKLIKGTRPLLFLHSALASGKELEPLRKRFLDRTTIEFDLPGHGESITTRNALDTAFVAECLLAALDKLEIQSFDIIGYSLGGYIGLEMATQAPMKVRSVVSHAMKYYWTFDRIEAAVETFSKAKTNPETISLLATLLRHFNTRQLDVPSIRHSNVPLFITTGALDEFVTPAEVEKLSRTVGEPQATCEIISEARHSFRSLPLEYYESRIREFWNTIKH